MNQSSHKAVPALTDVQEAASAWNDGSLLLLAGPGSGKTRVLTARIIRLLRDSPNAHWRIAALTFTTRAGDEMRSRIVSALPEAEHRLFVGTFHSFACEMLRQSGTHVGVKTDFNIYSDNRDRVVLLQNALWAAEIEYRGDFEKLLNVIDRMRDRLVGPDECVGFFADPAKGAAFAPIYQAYEEYLQQENALDFSGLIYKAHQLFTRYPAIADKYRKTYKFLHLDEFQDTNESQYAFLRKFTGDYYGNVFVVADDDQIIYQWNGASHKRLGQFREDYAPAEFQMPTNFRCPAYVVELANRLVAHNNFRSLGKEPLIAGKEDASEQHRVRVFRYPTDDDEVRAIAAEISLNDPKLRESTVVIARTKALLEKAKDALNETGVKARIAQRRDEFVSKPFQSLQAVLEVSNRPTDVISFERFVSAMNAVLGIDIDPIEVQAGAALSNGNLLQAWCIASMSLENITHTSLLEALKNDLANRQDFRRFISKWAEWYQAEEPHLEDQFPSIDEDARAWRDLYSEINGALGQDASLDAFLQELHLRSKEPKLLSTEIPLLTIHGSKGNEFDHVYLIGMAEDVLPSFQARQQGPASPQMEEERRNCFVAITRCMETLTMTFADNYRGRSRAKSRFLTEMGY